MEVSSKFVPFLVLILVAVLDKQAFATTHVVGGSQGWDTSTDLSTWASKTTFKVDDELEFKYTAGLHSVVELPNEDAFKNCDIGTSNPLTRDKIKLTKSGTRFFACGTSGHCGLGMKVKITTVAADGSSSSSSSATTPLSSTGATPSNLASSHQVQFFSFFALVASLVVSFI